MTNEEFAQKAQAYTQDARSRGISDLIIYNTIKMKYAQFLSIKTEEREKIVSDRQYDLDVEKQKLAETGEFAPTGQTDDDGYPILYNKVTGETKIGDPEANLKAGLSSDGTTGDNLATLTPTPTTDISTFDPNAQRMSRQEPIKPEQAILNKLGKMQEEVGALGIAGTGVQKVSEATGKLGEWFAGLPTGIENIGRKFLLGKTVPQVENPFWK